MRANAVRQAVPKTALLPGLPPLWSSPHRYGTVLYDIVWLPPLHLGYGEQYPRLLNWFMWYRYGKLLYLYIEFVSKTVVCLTSYRTCRRPSTAAPTPTSTTLGSPCPSAPRSGDLSTLGAQKIRLTQGFDLLSITLLQGFSKSLRFYYHKQLNYIWILEV